MSTISPEQFMTQPPEPDEEFDAATWAAANPPLAPAVPDPLTYIAAALERIEDTIRFNVAEENTSYAFREAFADLEAKYAVAFELVEEIEAIVKPSTSKLADTVRAAIGRWKAPKLTPEPEETAAEHETWCDGTQGCGMSGCAREHPSHDAPVEQWREYARVCGVLPDEPDAIDSMNRSQIRSMLGIAQPGTPVAPSVVHAS